MRSCVGGKAVNLARVLARRGHAVHVLGVAAGSAGDFVERDLAREGIPGSFVRVSGESRLATTILDPAHGTHTEVNEAGPHVTAEEAEQALAQFAALLPEANWCAIGGSAPPGFPEDVYARMVGLCRARGVPVLLDTNRQWLAGSFRSGPEVLKPNEAELASIASLPVSDEASAVTAARSVVATGTETVLVTRGAEGALAVSASAALRGRVEVEVRVLSAVGSGDAFLAGYLAAWIEGADLADRLRLALACGAANAEVFGPGFLEADRVEELRRASIVEPLD